MVIMKRKRISVNVNGPSGTVPSGSTNVDQKITVPFGPEAKKSIPAVHFYGRMEGRKRERKPKMEKLSILFPRQEEVTYREIPEESWHDLGLDAITEKVAVLSICSQGNFQI